MTECEEIAETMLNGYKRWLALWSQAKQPNQGKARQYVKIHLDESYQVIDNVAEALHRRVS